MMVLSKLRWVKDLWDRSSVSWHLACFSHISNYSRPDYGHLVSYFQWLRVDVGVSKSQTSRHGNLCTENPSYWKWPGIFCRAFRLCPAYLGSHSYGILRIISRSLIATVRLSLQIHHAYCVLDVGCCQKGENFCFIGIFISNDSREWEAFFTGDRFFVTLSINIQSDIKKIKKNFREFFAKIDLIHKFWNVYPKSIEMTWTDSKTCIV